MRPIARVVATLGTVLAVACGSADRLTAPPPSELAFTLKLSPDASGGMRPSTAVSAMLFVDSAPPNTVVSGTLESAEFTAFDGQGGVLARETVAGPLAFEANGTLTVRQVLDWTPADLLGRSLKVRFVLGDRATPTVIERTITF